MIFFIFNDVNEETQNVIKSTAMLQIGNFTTLSSLEEYTSVRDSMKPLEVLDWQSWLLDFHVVIIFLKNKKERRLMCHRSHCSIPVIIRGINMAKINESITDWLYQSLMVRLGKDWSQDALIVKFRNDLERFFWNYYKLYSGTKGKWGLDLLRYYKNCPWCRSSDLKQENFKTPDWTWRRHCGREGFILSCQNCGRIIDESLINVS